MAKNVHTGWAMASAFVHHRLHDGQNTHAHHSDHAKWRLGMAAYWFDTLLIGPEWNDHRPPTESSVSTNPWPMRRGGIKGNNANPIRANAVVNASVFRHSG